MITPLFPTTRRDAVGGDLVQIVEQLWPVLTVAGVAVGAYHGYKRNDSVGWAVGWAVLGGLFPVIVIPVAFAQGMSKHK